MKKLLLIALLALTLSACSKEENNALVGKWNFVRAYAELEDGTQEVADSYNNRLAGSYILFTEDKFTNEMNSTFDAKYYVESDILYYYIEEGDEYSVEGWHEWKIKIEDSIDHKTLTIRHYMSPHWDEPDDDGLRFEYRK